MKRITTFGLALFCPAATLVLACAPASSSSSLVPPSPAPVEYDLGHVLARGQTLHHEFTLSNPTDRSLRLLGAEASTPCCSKVGSLPKTVRPGSSAKVPVSFRPPAEPGPRRLEFVVRTDDPLHPERRFILLSTLVQEFEARPLEGSDYSLAIAQPGTRRLEIISRQVSGEGLGDPLAVEAVKPLTARFVGPARVERSADGLVQTTRLVEVTLPASEREGMQQGAIRLLWPTGVVRECPVGWEVVPMLRVSPALVLLDAGQRKTKRTIVVRSTDKDQPFRILGASGAVVLGTIPPSEEAKVVHHLDLNLDSERLTNGGDPNVVITTDHPNQCEVSLKVIVAPATRSP